ncbi:MAG: hypothetical protein IKM05_03800, partial [Clostridia bacterium]|nr:hypothetical protein [Clostridia bacterium]
KGAPRNLYEAMQITMVYYTLQHHFEGTHLRTLGRLDNLFYPFYKKELTEIVGSFFFHHAFFHSHSA